MVGIPVRPMLAVAAPLPHVAGWAFEFKWDGVRAIGGRSADGLRLFARSGTDVTVSYPELAGLARAVPDAVLDGEIVALTTAGPSFGALAERMHVTDPARARRMADTTPVTYLVFDLLRLEGRDLCPLPYTDRRAALEELVADSPHWLVPPRFDDGAATLAASAQQELEGVVAKRCAAPYRPGRRSPDWIKVKHVHTDDMIVGGYRPGARPIGALLIGETGPAGLTYRGRVGGGIGERDQADLLRLLGPLRRNRSPFADPVPDADARGAVWVAPELVVEVAYGNRTVDGRLRFGRLRRIRTDREPW